MSNGNDGRRGNSTSRSRSGRARWSCRGKEPGADPENPASREKTILVKTAGETLGVTAGSLLPAVGVARGTYHYQPDAMKRPDKDAPLLELVREAFENSERRYGYKRIHLEPESMGVRVSAKRIMRLMTSHGLVPLFKSAKRYGSYKGELTKAPKNLVNRDFHAERPNMLWVTDLTEFSIPAGKAYLSPVIDCHDGMPVAWTIGTSPDSALANGMLADACSTLKDGEKPIIHSDRGCHYRWPEWIRIRKDNNLTRSTGAKGCSPDNAAAEGFFGRPRQEFFHKRSFAGVSMDWFIGMLDEYMVRYRDKRIKTESGHGHHEPAAQTRSCGMIGGDGINDESNKTAPAPSDRHFLYILVPSIGNRGSSQAPSSSKPVSKLFDAPSTSFPQQKGPVENEIM
ncbi:MAG: IS3 family transposase [Bifidobacterium breve]